MPRWKDVVDMLVRKLKINRGQSGFRASYVPGFASLTLVTYAPTVSIPVPLVLVPTTRALVLTKYAPAVGATSDIPVVVTVPKATLTLATFAPTVTGVAPISVTVPRTSLVTATFAPSLTVTGANPVLVTPTTKALTTARFAPTVTAVNPITVTPPRRAVVLTTLAPTVTVPTHWVLVPTKRSLVTQRFAPVVSVGTLNQFPPSTVLTRPTPPTPPAIPAYLTPYTDPTWGTTITRVSNVHGQRNQYSRMAGWNSNGTMILLGATDIQPVPAVLDGNSYVKLHDLPFLVGFSQWANTNPNKIYGTWVEENYLRSQTWNGSSWTLNIEHTFTGYTSISLGDGEGGLSDDDDTIVLMTKTSTGMHGMLVFDNSSKTIVATKNFSTSAWPDTCFVSRSGQYVLAYWSSANGGGGTDGTGPTQGLWQYDRNLNLIRQLSSAVRHGDPARLADGTDVWAHCGFGGEFFRMDNGAQQYLFDDIQPYPHNTAFSLGHCSGRATGRNGWVYYSVYNYPNTGSGQLLYGRDQIIAANLDNPGEIQVFGWSHHRNDGQSGTNYPTNPFAVPSRDGTRVLFGSEWGDTAPYGAVYAYIAEKT